MTPAEAHITVQPPDHGLWQFCHPARPDLHGAARRHLHHHGRQWVRQEYPAAPSDRLEAAGPGEVQIDGESFWEASPEAQDRLKRRFGVLFQSGALWSSMTLAENVALPLEQYTALSAAAFASRWR